MHCVACDTDWCYLCGLGVDDPNMDRAPRTGQAAADPLYGHNEDWEINTRRCPMFLSAIGMQGTRFVRGRPGACLYTFMHTAGRRRRPGACACKAPPTPPLVCLCV